MTTINHGDGGRVRTTEQRSRSSEDGVGGGVEARVGAEVGVGVGSRRYWLWASFFWLAVVAGTAVVAMNETVTVAAVGMVVAAICGALAHPEPSPDDVPLAHDEI